MLIEAPRYPVFALWAYHVARRAGFREGEAKSIAVGIASLNAASKFGGGKYVPKRKGGLSPKPPSPGRRDPADVDLLPFMGRKIYVTQVGDELRALLHSGGSAKVIDPAEFDRKVVNRLGSSFDTLSRYFARLARNVSPAEVTGRGPYNLYAKYLAPTKVENGRPVYRDGKPVYPGRGVPGAIDLGRLEALL